MSVTDITRPARLSKSRVTAGLQCHKLLWLTVHEPGAPEFERDERSSVVMERGIRVGELARTYVPRGVLIDLPYYAYAERLAATEEALRRGESVIYEAAFAADGVFVSVDILERRGSSYCLVEVKSTASVKQQHIPDVAIQTHVLRQSGIDVTRMELMHLDRRCAYPDLSNLFARQDVTAAVEALLSGIPWTIAAQGLMLSGPQPTVAVGDHCSAPYACPFLQRCWPTLPADHVSTLYKIRERARQLDEDGYHTIHDLPDDVQLGAIADRQRRAVQTGRLVVEPGLSEALAAIVPPIAFLDFETIALAVPVWNSCHPYDAVPVQFSCHVLHESGEVRSHAWLADGPEDPRPALAERLVAACAGARTVVAYNAPFERRCLEQLSAVVPHLSLPLMEIAGRLADLLPVVRNHVYHPDFGGSFSLKRVLPALVPELNYGSLAIGDGEIASAELERLLFGAEQMAPEFRDKLRRDLAAYCSQDTWGLVQVFNRLRTMI